MNYESELGWQPLSLHLLTPVEHPRIPPLLNVICQTKDNHCVRNKTQDEDAVDEDAVDEDAVLPPLPPQNVPLTRIRPLNRPIHPIIHTCSNNRRRYLRRRHITLR